MKKTIRLTESELRYIIKEAINELDRELLPTHRKNYRVYNCSEILKDYDGNRGHIYEDELEIIKAYSPKYKVYDDKANGYIAFALSFKDEDKANDLVDKLNKITEDGWYVGDETEEYVFVD